MVATALSALRACDKRVVRSSVSYPPRSSSAARRDPVRSDVDVLARLSTEDIGSLNAPSLPHRPLTSCSRTGALERNFHRRKGFAPVTREPECVSSVRSVTW